MKAGRSIVVSYVGTLRDLIGDRAVLTFAPKDKVSDITERMHASGTGAGGVVNSFDTLIGLVTEGSIVRRKNGRHGKSLARMTAMAVMIAHPDALRIDDTIEDAFNTMAYLSHRYMPVLKQKNRLAGIVSLEELKQYLSAKTGMIIDRDDPFRMPPLLQLGTNNPINV
jgi:CBS domain-containing protein